MKRWTEAQARSSNITDYEQFNKEYNAHKSSLNGGIDRNQLAQNGVTKAMVEDYAMHRVYLNDHGEFKTTEFTDASVPVTTLKEFWGLTYTTYNGGWINIVEQDYTNLKDGMLYIEFISHLFINIYFSMGGGDGVAPGSGSIQNKGVQLAIEWNGVPLLNTFEYTLPWQTIRLFANTFAPAGTGKLVVRAKMTPKGKTDWLHKVQMHFWGMRSLVIGRWR